MYIYNRTDWPHFIWDAAQISPALMSVKFEQGRILGKMENLVFQIQESAVLETLTSEVIKSSEIEGELLSVEEVRSSIARHLGMDITGLLPADRHVDGIVEMLLDATRHYDQLLTEERLQHWHALLFPTGMSGMMLVNPGVWRSDSGGPMRIVSGQYGREKVHFQAPPAKQLPQELEYFIKWFNQEENNNIDPILKAGIAHFWFVTIHPFDDGNGRISRAITDMALAKADKQANRFYSMSTQIRKHRKSYYEILESSQKGTLDITKWLLWFLNCLQQAMLQSESVLEHVLNKSKFWALHSDKTLNERQITMLNLLFDGFTGKLTSIKWAKIMKCSQDTASRDINHLIQLGILIKSDEKGRSMNYLLRDFPINLLSSIKGNHVFISKR